jgi:hypothetical protein
LLYPWQDREVANLGEEFRMKIFAVMMIAAVMTVATGASANEGDVHNKTVMVSDVYIPSGFDSSSDAFVVVNGFFPHSCYKMADVNVKNISPTVHEITATANVTEGLCLMVIVPYHKEVQLGKLVPGTHTLHFMNGDGTYMEKQLTIER